MSLEEDVGIFLCYSSWYNFRVLFPLLGLCVLVLGLQGFGWFVLFCFNIAILNQLYVGQTIRIVRKIKQNQRKVSAETAVIAVGWKRSPNRKTNKQTPKEIRLFCPSCFQNQLGLFLVLSPLLLLSRLAKFLSNSSDSNVYCGYRSISVSAITESDILVFPFTTKKSKVTKFKSLLEFLPCSVYASLGLCDTLQTQNGLRHHCLALQVVMCIPQSKAKNVIKPEHHPCASGSWQAPEI